MKLKIAILFILTSVAFASCSKKQCPAYGSSPQEADVEVVNA
jgi:hypothetical protein